jgi:serine/threonine protein phosphatase PrpC
MEADSALAAEIRSFGASIERLHELAYHLVQSADVSDGRDNITLVVVGFVQQQTEDKTEEKAPCGSSDEVNEVLDPLDDTEVEVVSRPSSSERKSQKKSKTTSRRRTKSSTRSRSSQKKSV